MAVARPTSWKWPLQDRHLLIFPEVPVWPEDCKLCEQVKRSAYPGQQIPLSSIGIRFEVTICRLRHCRVSNLKILGAADPRTFMAASFGYLWTDRAHKYTWSDDNDGVFMIVFCNERLLSKVRFTFKFHGKVIVGLSCRSNLGVCLQMTLNYCMVCFWNVAILFLVWWEIWCISVWLKSCVRVQRTFKNRRIGTCISVQVLSKFAWGPCKFNSRMQPPILAIAHVAKFGDQM